MIRSAQKTRLCAVMALAGAVAWGCGAGAGHVEAADFPYPTKPIRMLAPEPGGGNEIAGRTIAQALSIQLGQNLVVENRGAASGAIAGEILAHATPDGYTLLYYGSTVWLLPYLRDKVPFDPVKDFAPVSLGTRAPFYLFVHPSVKANSVRELIDYAKAHPGKLNYGSAGSGAATHLTAELFKIVAGVDIVRIAYKGSGLASNALVTGEVQLMFVSGSVGLPHVRAGRLKALAIASPGRSSLSPEVPTMAESGLPGYEASSMSGMFAPAKTPRAIVKLLSDEVARALKRDDVKQSFVRRGTEAVGSTPEEFAAIIREDMAKWSRVIKAAGINEKKGR
ncbi:MAG: tripartite tricarboxylate transporter substrate binding protein [Betaproteobacteria bacterium]|nr:tripartite tricarboxylate transporter substrate binding protein [Betaproteobacteria bacterium]